MTSRSRARAFLSTAVAALMIAGSALMAPAAFAEEPTGPASEQAEVVQGSADPGAGEAEVPAEGTAPQEDGADVPAVKVEDPTETPDGSDPAVSHEVAPAEDEAPARATAAADDAAVLMAEEAAATSEVSNAKLEWGLRQSFRNYIKGPIAQGSITPLGGVASTAPDAAEGIFQWSGGSGTVNADGPGFDVSFRGEDGVRFQGHKHGADYVLELQFTHPRIVAISSTEAKLYLDVEGREFAGTTTVGDRYTLENVYFADVTLPDPEVSETVYTWTKAAAVMTDDGLEAFGGFYGPEQRELDPVTFSTSSDGSGNPAPAPAATTTALSASKQAAEQGAEITLTATVAPSAAAGSVQFLNAGEELGAAVQVSSGSATLKTKSLPVGKNTLTAVFTPSDPTGYGSSTSAVVTVEVTKAKVPTPEQPKPVNIKGATLDWAVKDSFLSYVKGPIAHGTVTRVGGTTGEFRWSGGAGTAMNDGSKAEVSFTGGVHFTGHEMTAGGVTGHALDMRFTNPRVQITSATAATLYLDVKSRKFEGMTSISQDFVDKKKVPFATLQLAAPTASGSTLSWRNAPANLTAQGAEAFGGFYEAGIELAPVSFSLPADGDVISKKPVATKLKASSAKVEKGTQVALTASVSPKVAGVVTFSSGGKQLGQPIGVKNGVATLQTRSLPVGVHSIVASFVPGDSDYGNSVSNSVQVTVTAPPGKPKPPTNPGSSSGQTAGSLSWGISAKFIAYTTCEGKENYGMSHCAKGSVSTSGVGAGYLFPQASSSSWNRAAQTGTVNYGGTVSFSGYGMTMFSVSNPSITVTSPTSATLRTGNTTPYGAASYQLDLASGSKSVGANGEVTWSNVPVLGSLSSGGAGGSGNQSIGFDNLTFTVGAASGVSYGSTQAGANATQKREPAAEPPATTGITVLTDEEKLVAGGRIEIEAAGFEPDEDGILVVIYSDPVVLDEDAKADANGNVRWSGTLPRDLDGTHTITLQGSINAGAVIDIQAKDAEKKSAKQTAQVEIAEQDLAAEQLAAAGVVPGSGPGGMPLWEWWVSALGLVAIACCTTLLAVRQRRAAE